MHDLLSTINDPIATPAERLAALEAYEATHRSAPTKTDAAAAIAATGASPVTDAGATFATATGQVSAAAIGQYAEVNNHIHTIYSFSPYTPSMAALKARDAGLAAAGSVDHDSISAAAEMVAACRIVALGGCSGFELRVSFKRDADGRPSRFAERKINNPDSIGLAYMTIQGVPAPALPQVQRFLEPIQERRNDRDRRMTAAINRELEDSGLRPLDFNRDIYAYSKAAEGGSITERHLLAGLSRNLIERFGRGPELTAGVSASLGLSPSPKIAALLADPHNPHYLFDLLGFLKSAFLDRVFIQPDEAECPSAREVVAFARSIGAIPAYAYLGDVGESPTGDKKAEKFEDDYLDELFDELADIGYKAVAYMPPRNSLAQLRRVQRLCAERGFMEISGVDINSSRQSFNCPEVLQSDFRHLVDTTWALVAHERLSGIESALDLFAAANPLAAYPLSDRLAAYAVAGRAITAAGKTPDAADKLAAIVHNLKNRRFP